MGTHNILMNVKLNFQHLLNFLVNLLSFSHGLPNPLFFKYFLKALS
jgi:hypothetical protein